MKKIEFHFGETTESYFACPAVFKGMTFFLGGKREFNQVFLYNLIFVSIIFLDKQIRIMRIDSNGQKIAIHIKFICTSLLWRFFIQNHRRSSSHLPSQTMLYVGFNQDNNK